MYVNISKNTLKGYTFKDTVGADCSHMIFASVIEGSFVAMASVCTYLTFILCCFQVKLTEFSKTPEDFLKKYEELKSKNVRNLDPLVYLLSKLCEDKEVIPENTVYSDVIG